jgi:hypothetical protein
LISVHLLENPEKKIKEGVIDNTGSLNIKDLCEILKHNLKKVAQTI